MVVAVIPNLDKRGAAEVVEKLGLILKKENITAYLPDSICATDFLHAEEEKLYSMADVIITIGGDGTIIRYAKRAAMDNKPVLGINSENGKVINEFNALNDAVITSGFISRIIDVSVTVGADSINYRADGLIISTPTGSTAYSMSAGGPIIDPLTESMCITPICSHSLSAKPILLGANNIIKLKAFSKKRTDIYLTVDGRKVAQIKPYTEITIKQAEQSAQLIRLNDRSFYKTLSYKFKDARSM